MKNVYKALIYVVITLSLDAICLFLMASRGEAFNLNIGFLNGVLLVLLLSIFIPNLKGQKQYRDFIASIYYGVATVLNFLFLIFKLSNITVGVVVNIAILVISLIFYLAVMAKVNKDGTEEMF
ncbi:MAG: hypothetical protein IKA39_01275 [Clostridia bacterium]|nr:hypothetical protein [Clostridia bacterium]